MRLVLLAALLLGACGGPAEPTPSDGSPSTQTVQQCSAAASKAWDTGAGGVLTIEATAAGPDCTHAAVQLTIVNAQSATLYDETYPSEHVMTLAGASSAADLQTKIAEWIAGAPTTSGTLPDWPEGAAQPMSGEFPFYPKEGVTREAYLEARAADAPMFCFVQGMESQACLVFRDGRITNLGAQSFPG